MSVSIISDVDLTKTEKILLTIKLTDYFLFGFFFIHAHKWKFKTITIFQALCDNV